jgi:glutaredoxin-like protein NrdH
VPTITVYTKPGCVQCTATLRALTQAGIRYTLVDVSHDLNAHETVRGLGYSAVPVVIVDRDTHWAGFRPDRIQALAKTPEEAA